MRNYLRKLILNDFENNFKNVNQLIKCGKLEKNEVLNVLIATKSISVISNIPNYIEDIPLDVISDVIINVGTPFEILTFLKKQPSAPKDKLIKGFIAKSIYENNYTYFHYLKNIPEIDIKKVQDALKIVNRNYLITNNLLKKRIKELDKDDNTEIINHKDYLKSIKLLIFPPQPSEIMLLIDNISFLKMTTKEKPKKLIKKV